MTAKFFLFTLAVVVLKYSGGAQDSFAQDNFAFMGVGSCSSSNCHGSVSPRNAGNILQNEYVTWEKHDAHSKAWLNLTNSDSKRIAHNLGIESPEKEPLCLKCHATYLESDSRKGANYHIEDGVGCESCHGAAEKYLGPHTANDATRESNVANGMLDIFPLEKRAALCSECHFGNEDKYVNHRLIGAGHPRLTFELDTFSMIQPKHWLVDEDYEKRKGGYNSTRAWLIGQIELADLAVKRLQSEKLSKVGMYPELTLFYCYSCHHSLLEEQWKTREYNGRPGELQPNFSSALILREAFKVIEPETGEEIGRAIKTLHDNMRQGSTKGAAELGRSVQRARTALQNINDSNELSHRLLKAIVKFGATGSNFQYELAEQVAMGASSLLASLSPDGTLYKPQVDDVYAALSEPRAFRPQAFAEANRRFEAALDR